MLTIARNRYSAQLKKETTRCQLIKNKRTPHKTRNHTENLAPEQNPDQTTPDQKQIKHEHDTSQLFQAFNCLLKKDKNTRFRLKTTQALTNW